MSIVFQIYFSNRLVLKAKQNQTIERKFSNNLILCASSNITFLFENDSICQSGHKFDQYSRINVSLDLYKFNLTALS